jgi:hypothetical protein
MTQKHNERTQKGGFILLLTIIVTSIIMAISFGIYSLTLKELLVASFLRNSNVALMAASRGVECAFYWDRMPSVSQPEGLTYSIFANSGPASDPTLYQPEANQNKAKCEGKSLVSESSWSVPQGTLTANSGITNFTLTFADKSCAKVVVKKENEILTTISSNGYNVCTSDPRQTMRTLVVVYNVY